MKKHKRVLTGFLSAVLILCLGAFVIFAYLDSRTEITFKQFALDEKPVSESGADSDENPEFEDLITLYDPSRKVLDILGEPDRIEGETYYYKHSYLLFEDDRVIGFYNADGLFPVTLGEKIRGAEEIKVGAGRQDVIRLYGTPRLCTEYVWYYKKISVEFNQEGRVCKLSDMESDK